MKIIALTQGKSAIVDDEDFEWINQWKWHYKDGYAVRSITVKDPSRKSGYKAIAEHMHRVINKTDKSLITDHINGNSLDNRKANLRSASKTQNNHNAKIKKNNNCGYKGVYLNKNVGKWEARIRTSNKKRIYLGLFLCKEEAAKAYNKAALKHHGEFARLNEIPNEYL